MTDPYSVTVSISFLAPVIAFAFVGVSLSIGLLGYIFKKDPTIRWRAQRKSWGWSLWVSPANDIKILPIMEEDVDPTTKSFDYIPAKEVGYTHMIESGVNSADGTTKINKDNLPDNVKPTSDGATQFTHKEESSNEKKQVTQFTHKGHPAWIHTWDQVGPHGFVKNSLEASTSPEAVYRCKDGSVRKQIDSIRIGEKVHKSDITVVALVIVVVIVSIMSYAQSSQISSFLQSHFGSTTTAPTNSTASSQCPSGYVLNTSGRCVPQGIPLLDTIGLFSMPFNVAFSSREWRKFVRLSKLKARILSVLSVIFLPSLTLYFLVSKSYYVYEAGGGQDFDYSLVFIVLVLFFIAGFWTIGSLIGDAIFLFRNKWVRYSGMPLSKSRQVILSVPLIRTNDFWNLVDKLAWIENWLSFYISSRPTVTYSGDMSSVT